MSYQFDLQFFNEIDGKLGAFETDMIPGFQAQRIFCIYDVPENESRGNHACMNASIVFVVVSGSVTLSIETSGIIKEYTLKERSKAVFVPYASWIKAYNFSSDAILICISDKLYQECIYINNYDQYKVLTRNK